MNWDIVEGNWKQMKGSLKEKWGKLTDSDIAALSGKKDQFLGVLQERNGYSKDQAEREADEWAKANEQRATTRRY